MGRFYKTAQGRFIDDNIYTPPWELAQQVIGTHEARTDQALAKTALLDESLSEIRHLNFEEENERVRQARENYSSRIEDLSSEIAQNPLNYLDYTNKIRSLQKEMITDRTSGDLYQVEKRYDDYANWLENNKGKRESNPTLFNQLNQSFLNDIITRASEDPSATFQGKQIIDRPEIMSKFSDVFAKLKADSVKTSDGRYMVGEERVSEQRLASMAWNMIQSDPNYLGYLDQMGNTLGLPGYLDQQGQPTSAFKLVDGAGNEISFEQFQNMSPEQQKQAKQIINSRNPFASDLYAVTGFAYQERDLEVDPYGRSTQDFQEAMALQRMKDAADMQKIGLRYKYQYKLAKAKGDIKEQESVIIATAPKQVASISELETLSQEFMNLEGRLGTGQGLSGDEQIRHNKLDAMFGNVTSRYGDDIISAFGEDPSKYTTPEAKKARVANIVAEINKARKDPNYGIVTTPGNRLQSFQEGGSEDIKDASYRNQIMSAVDALEESYGDFSQMMAESMVVNVGFMPADDNSPLGKRGLNMINQLLDAPIQPSIHAIGLDIYDMEGNVRAEQRVDVDVSWFSSGQTSTPMQDIMQALGVTNATELVEGNYGSFRWRMDRGETLIDFVPNRAAFSEAGIDISDRFNNGEGFTMRYSNAQNNFFEGQDLSNPEVFNLYLRSDGTLSTAAQKVDNSISALKASGGENVMPFQMPGSDTFYKIQMGENGAYTLMESVGTGEEASWRPTTSQTASGAKTVTTRDPNAIMLYLRQRAIQN